MQMVLLSSILAGSSPVMGLLIWVGLIVAMLVVGRITWKLEMRDAKARAEKSKTAAAKKPPAGGAFKHCPWCAAELKLGKVEGDKERLHCSCGYINWNNPVPVAVVVIPSRGGVVLVKRAIPPAVGAWALPAGFVDQFESPEDAAKREAFEETGMKVTILRLLKVVMTPGRNNMLMFYLAAPCQDDIVVSSESQDVKSFALDQLPEMPFSTHRDILRECIDTGALRAS